MTRRVLTRGMLAGFRRLLPVFLSKRVELLPCARAHLITYDKPTEPVTNDKYYSVTRSVYGLSENTFKRIFHPYTYKPLTFEYSKKNVPTSSKKLQLLCHMISKAPVSFSYEQLELRHERAAENMKNMIQEAMTPFIERGIPSEQVYIKSINVIKAPSIKGMTFQPNLRTRRIRKTFSHVSIVLVEGVPLPRNITRHHNTVRVMLKHQDPFEFIRKYRPPTTIYWRKNRNKRPKRPIK